MVAGSSASINVVYSPGGAVVTLLTLDSFCPPKSITLPSPTRIHEGKPESTAMLNPHPPVGAQTVVTWADTWLAKLTQELNLRNYSPETLKIYRHSVRLLLLRQSTSPLKMTSQGIPKLKEAQTLPRTFSISEAESVIACALKPKHRLALSLAYGCGMRISELAHLRLEDLDFGRTSATARVPRIVLSCCPSPWKPSSKNSSAASPRGFS